MYEIRNTEQNNKTASDYETKALLYMLAIDKRSDDISIFFIDCFNDVTGADLSCEMLWDVQSKGVKSLRPKTLGEAMITLFLNYSSDLLICKSLLFIPRLKDGYLVDENALQFHINNFQEKKRDKVKEGLVCEHLRRLDVEKLPSGVDQEIDQFLSDVLFVTACPDEANYVRDIVEFKDKDIKHPEFYKSIFREIRDRQTALKNINVEGVKYKHPSDLLEYDKHLKKNDITILIVNRLIGIELFDDSQIPISYSEELDGVDSDERKDIVQHNNECLAKTLFNKNNKLEFWFLLEKIVMLIKDHPASKPRMLYENLPRSMLAPVHTLDESSVIYFISLVKDGFNDAN